MTRKRSSPLGLDVPLLSLVALTILLLPLLAEAAPLQDATDMQQYMEGCYYNYNHYTEGDRILTNEPCLNCTCHNRMLMCYLRVCPFTKPIGHDCIMEKREDQCCPIMTCPEVPVDVAHHTSSTPGTELSIPEKFGCSIDEKFYPEGAQVPSNPNKPCELCYCIKNRTSCLIQECTLHIDGCTPIYNRGSCCPVRYNCDHENDVLELEDLSTTTTTTVRPSTGYILTTTMTPDVSTDCIHNGDVYADGASITGKSACEHCYCMRGDIVCAVQECDMPLTASTGKSCRALPAAKGECCPSSYVCEDESGTTEIVDFATTTPTTSIEDHTKKTSEEEDEIVGISATTTAAPSKDLPGTISDEDLKLQDHIDDEDDKKAPKDVTTIKPSGQDDLHADIDVDEKSTEKPKIGDKPSDEDEELGSGEVASVSEITVERKTTIAPSLADRADVPTSTEGGVTSAVSVEELDEDEKPKGTIAPELSEDSEHIPTSTTATMDLSTEKDSTEVTKGSGEEHDATATPRPIPDFSSIRPHATEKGPEQVTSRIPSIDIATEAEEEGTSTEISTEADIDDTKHDLSPSTPTSVFAETSTPAGLTPAVSEGEGEIDATKEPSSTKVPTVADDEELGTTIAPSDGEKDIKKPIAGEVPTGSEEEISASTESAEISAEVSDEDKKELDATTIPSIISTKPDAGEKPSTSTSSTPTKSEDIDESGESDESTEGLDKIDATTVSSEDKKDVKKPSETTTSTADVSSEESKEDETTTAPGKLPSGDKKTDLDVDGPSVVGEPSTDKAPEPSTTTPTTPVSSESTEDGEGTTVASEILSEDKKDAEKPVGADLTTAATPLEEGAETTVAGDISTDGKKDIEHATTTAPADSKYPDTSTIRIIPSEVTKGVESTTVAGEIPSREDEVAEGTKRPEEEPTTEDHDKKEPATTSESVKEDQETTTSAGVSPSGVSQESDETTISGVESSEEKKEKPTTPATISSDITKGIDATTAATVSSESQEDVGATTVVDDVSSEDEQGVEASTVQPKEPQFTTSPSATSGSEEPEEGESTTPTGPISAEDKKHPEATTAAAPATVAGEEDKKDGEATTIASPVEKDQPSTTAGGVPSEGLDEAAESTTLAGDIIPQDKKDASATITGEAPTGDKKTPEEPSGLPSEEQDKLETTTSGAITPEDTQEADVAPTDEKKKPQEEPETSTIGAISAEDKKDEVSEAPTDGKKEPQETTISGLPSEDQEQPESTTISGAIKPEDHKDVSSESPIDDKKEPQATTVSGVPSEGQEQSETTTIAGATSSEDKKDGLGDKKEAEDERETTTGSITPEDQTETSSEASVDEKKEPQATTVSGVPSEDQGEPESTTIAGAISSEDKKDTVTEAADGKKEPQATTISGVSSEESEQPESTSIAIPPEDKKDKVSEAPVDGKKEPQATTVSGVSSEEQEPESTTIAGAVKPEDKKDTADDKKEPESTTASAESAEDHEETETTSVAGPITTTQGKKDAAAVETTTSTSAVSTDEKVGATTPSGISSSDESDLEATTVAEEISKDKAPVDKQKEPSGDAEVGLETETTTQAQLDGKKESTIAPKDDKETPEETTVAGEVPLDGTKDVPSEPIDGSKDQADTDKKDIPAEASIDDKKDQSSTAPSDSAEEAEATTPASALSAEDKKDVEATTASGEVAEEKPTKSSTEASEEESGFDVTTVSVEVSNESQKELTSSTSRITDDKEEQTTAPSKEDIDGDKQDEFDKKKPTDVTTVAGEISSEDIDTSTASKGITTDTGKDLETTTSSYKLGDKPEEVDAVTPKSETITDIGEEPASSTAAPEHKKDQVPLDESTEAIVAATSIPSVVGDVSTSGERAEEEESTESGKDDDKLATTIAPSTASTDATKPESATDATQPGATTPSSIPTEEGSGEEESSEEDKQKGDKKPSKEVSDEDDKDKKASTEKPEGSSEEDTDKKKSTTPKPDESSEEDDEKKPIVSGEEEESGEVTDKEKPTSKPDSSEEDDKTKPKPDADKDTSSEEDEDKQKPVTDGEVTGLDATSEEAPTTGYPLSEVPQKGDELIPDKSTEKPQIGAEEGVPATTVQIDTVSEEGSGEDKIEPDDTTSKPSDHRADIDLSTLPTGKPIPQADELDISGVTEIPATTKPADSTAVPKTDDTTDKSFVSSTVVPPSVAQDESAGDTSTPTSSTESEDQSITATGPTKAPGKVPDIDVRGGEPVTLKPTSDEDTSTDIVPDIVLPAVIPGEGDCLVGQKTYPHNSVVPSSDECEMACKCHSSIVVCQRIECEVPENREKCIIGSDDHCGCPTYICPDDEKVPTPYPPKKPISSEDKEIDETTLVPEVPSLDSKDKDTTTPKYDSTVDETTTHLPPDDIDIPSVTQAEPMSHVKTEDELTTGAPKLDETGSSTTPSSIPSVSEPSGEKDLEKPDKSSEEDASKIPESDEITTVSTPVEDKATAKPTEPAPEKKPETDADIGKKDEPSAEKSDESSEEVTTVSTPSEDKVSVKPVEAAAEKKPEADAGEKKEPSTSTEKIDETGEEVTPETSASPSLDTTTPALPKGDETAAKDGLATTPKPIPEEGSTERPEDKEDEGQTPTPLADKVDKEDESATKSPLSTPSVPSLPSGEDISSATIAPSDDKDVSGATGIPTETDEGSGEEISEEKTGPSIVTKPTESPSTEQIATDASVDEETSGEEEDKSTTTPSAIDKGTSATTTDTKKPDEIEPQTGIQGVQPTTPSTDDGEIKDKDSASTQPPSEESSEGPSTESVEEGLPTDKKPADKDLATPSTVAPSTDIPSTGQPEKDGLVPTQAPTKKDEDTTVEDDTTKSPAIPDDTGVDATTLSPADKDEQLPTKVDADVGPLLEAISPTTAAPGDSRKDILTPSDTTDVDATTITPSQEGGESEAQTPIPSDTSSTSSPVGDDKLGPADSEDKDAAHTTPLIEKSDKDEPTVSDIEKEVPVSTEKITVIEDVTGEKATTVAPIEKATTAPTHVDDRIGGAEEESTEKGEEDSTEAIVDSSTEAVHKEEKVPTSSSPSGEDSISSTAAASIDKATGVPSTDIPSEEELSVSSTTAPSIDKTTGIPSTDIPSEEDLTVSSTTAASIDKATRIPSTDIPSDDHLTEDKATTVEPLRESTEDKITKGPDTEEDILATTVSSEEADKPAVPVSPLGSSTLAPGTATSAEVSEEETTVPAISSDETKKDTIAPGTSDFITTPTTVSSVEESEEEGLPATTSASVTMASLPPDTADQKKEGEPLDGTTIAPTQDRKEPIDGGEDTSDETIDKTTTPSAVSPSVSDESSTDKPTDAHELPDLGTSTKAPSSAIDSEISPTEDATLDATTRRPGVSIDLEPVDESEESIESGEDGDRVKATTHKPTDAEAIEDKTAVPQIPESPDSKKDEVATPEGETSESSTESAVDKIDHKLDEATISTTAHPLFPHVTITTISPQAPIGVDSRLDTGNATDSETTPSTATVASVSPTTTTAPPQYPSSPTEYGQPPQYPNYPEDEYTDEEDPEIFGPGTCRYGGKLYVSAQQIPRDDPCDFCFCFRSDIICLQQSCPPPINGCHEEPISGFCCPRYECPVSMAAVLNITTSTTTTSTTLPPHFLHHSYGSAVQRNGCQINGRSYKVGERIESTSGPCINCTCGGDGKMKCDPQPCIPEPTMQQVMAVVAAGRKR